MVASTRAAQAAEAPSRVQLAIREWQRQLIAMAEGRGPPGRRTRPRPELVTMADNYEEQQRALDPHRLEEQRRAREEAEDRLRDRGFRFTRETATRRWPISSTASSGSRSSWSRTVATCW